MTNWKEGDIAIAKESFWPYLTKGEKLKVIKYAPEFYEKEAGFTWPAYLQVCNGREKHSFPAHRFIKDVQL